MTMWNHSRVDVHKQRLVRRFILESSAKLFILESSAKLLPRIDTFRIVITE